MSSTIGSPGWIVRSPGSWWGEAEFGPDATIANDADSWPSSTSRSRTSRLTSASVRPTSRPAAMRSTTRSAAWAAARSRSISSGDFVIRSARVTSVASPKPRPGSARCEPQQVQRPEARVDEEPRPRVHAGGRQLSRDDRVGIVGLVPGDDVDQPARMRRGSRRRPSPRGAARRGPSGRPPAARASSAARAGGRCGPSGTGGPRRSR